MAISAQVTELDRRFGREIRRAREIWDLTQRAVVKRLREAGMTHLHQPALMKIERGLRPVKLGEAAALAEAIGVPLVELIANSTDGLTRQIDAEIEATRRMIATLAEQQRELETARAAVLMTAEGRMTVGGAAPAAALMTSEGRMGGAVGGPTPQPPEGDTDA